MANVGTDLSAKSFTITSFEEYFKPIILLHAQMFDSELTFLASQDPVIEEILTYEEYCKNKRIQPFTVDLLHKVRWSITTIFSKTLSNHCKREFRQVIEKHDKRLKELTVQRKILEAAELKNSNQVWRRIMEGLPAGQMSFFLRAGSDTLPTLLNLRQ